MNITRIHRLAAGACALLLLAIASPAIAA